MLAGLNPHPENWYLAATCGKCQCKILIFRDLDLGDPPGFKYKLEYECRDRLIHIDADPARQNKREQVQITVQQGKEIPKAVPYTQFYGDSERQYLPSYVFGYYSGPSNRMEKHFDKHQDRFYRDLLRGVDKPLRPLLYARPVHSQFALLSFFTQEDEELAEGEQSIREFLNELLGIRELVSVLFIMRQPPWKSKEGDKRFWNARGVVGNLLAHLYEIALFPMRLKVRVTPEFASSTTLEHLYLCLVYRRSKNCMDIIKTNRNSLRHSKAPIYLKFSVKCASAYKGTMQMAP